MTIAHPARQRERERLRPAERVSTGTLTLASPDHPEHERHYAVAWVSLSDYYVASPTLVAADVNPAITYVAMAGNGAVASR